MDQTHVATPMICSRLLSDRHLQQVANHPPEQDTLSLLHNSPHPKMVSFVEEWMVGPESTKFYTRRYEAANPKALLVFCHGFSEHIARYEHVFPRWVAHNISVFCFDQRGFGRTALDKNKSQSSSYCWSSRPQQHADLEYFIKQESTRIGGPAHTVPVFLMGHSMGGGLVLHFATRTTGPPSADTINGLRGVIATSPMIRQVHTSPAVVRMAGSIIQRFVPWLWFPASVPSEHLSSDPSVGKKAENDPLMLTWGRARFLHDMLTSGEELADTSYADWPVDLPLLLVHGDEDQVTSFVATQEFSARIYAKDKTFKPYHGYFHELHNEPEIWEDEVDGIISWVEARL